MNKTENQEIADVETALAAAGCPDRFMLAVALYNVTGFAPVSPFVRAALERDIWAAVKCADPSIRVVELAAMLPAIDSVVPAARRGSAERVAAWIFECSERAYEDAAGAVKAGK